MTPGEKAELLGSCERLVLALARRIARRFGLRDVEDVASEVRLGFVLALGAYPGGVAFYKYARTAGIQSAYAYCRREQHRGLGLTTLERRSRPPEPVQFLAITEDIPDRGPGEPPGDQDAWWEERLAPLNDQQRAVLALHYRGGLSQREAALAVGVTQARIWKVLKDGIAKLKEES